jgi:hypothetical protein
MLPGEMKFLYQRLKSLPRFIRKNGAGYAGFRAFVVSAGDRLGIARLEFSNESFEVKDEEEVIAERLTLQLFQGDASRISDFDLEVAEAGLRIHLPNGSAVLASSPQTRSTIHMSPKASTEYGIGWSTHIVEAWTPSGNLPKQPDQQTLERLSGELHLNADLHWGNALILMPRFEGRLAAAEGIALEVEAAIEYDSRLISLEDIVLVREIREERSLWDREESLIAQLPVAKNANKNSQILLRDVASDMESVRWIGPIRGDGGDTYRMVLTSRDGALLDSRSVPLINRFRFDIEVSGEQLLDSDPSALKNPSWLAKERSEIDPNRPWRNRLPRDRFLGRPGVWLTKADQETVYGILGLIVLQASEFVKVVDPYASVASLDELVARLPTNIPISVITSRVNEEAEFVARLTELREDGYRVEIRRIHRDGQPSGTPLHDRSIVTSGAGWYLGTSFNSLATNASLIAEVTPADARRLEEQFDKWWSEEVIGKDGQPCSKEQL